MSIVGATSTDQLYIYIYIYIASGPTKLDMRLMGVEYPCQ